MQNRPSKLPPIRQAVQEIQLGNPQLEIPPSCLSGPNTIDALNKRWRNAIVPQQVQAQTFGPSMIQLLRFDNQNTKFRPTLPSLPSLTLEHGGSALGSWPNYDFDPSGSGIQSNFYPSSSTYLNPLSAIVCSYAQISDQSLLTSGSCFLERPGLTKKSAIKATKHQKRRINHSKNVKDKLHTWFVAHLHHPYPTEDEKQELMRDTKLQINQISNWFINARRRKLPAMINNASVESA